MTLAANLREALEQGRRRRPVLIGGDVLEEAGEPPTPAAVLVPIVDRPQPTIILTERLGTMRTHPGQISFPGGRIDPDDRDPTAAALREAEEEIGLPPHLVEVIGTADLYRTVTGFEVTPIVGVVPADLPLAAHPGEVAAIFEAPLDYLLEPRHQIVRRAEWRGRERSYYEIIWEGRRIWGATAAMIVNLSRRLELVA
ncbi:CoA pyrophosphatase [Sphingosinicella rhizophila]|uniref:CoA pyrophosphatase n=1 Tax=Sphingosinicella rhizophila TaxID=3050082 RepID=A0ABU3Q438_9SPHN|nr:CoA pyrophosphatase [Sphingosinicella sp. GR2756]MDT9598077.1 CoA pyrophosphatase [Sphingosinicella sp. GR2756]